MKRKQPAVSRSRLENLSWKITPTDYRTKWRGERAVLVHGTHGTTLKPLTEFSDAELIRYLGKHYVP